MSNNSTPLDAFLEGGHVTSLAVPFWTKPGFAIPLVQSRTDSNVSYVQRVNSARKIVGFDMFQGTARVLPLKQIREARVGDREVYALIDPEGNPHAGTQNELRPLVREWVGRVDSPLLRMSFARFCGEQKLAERSAADAVKLKASEFGSREQAILWFIDAVILAELVGILAEMHSKDSANDLLETTLATARLNKERVTLELPAFLLDKGAFRTKRQSGRLSKVLEFASLATGRNFDLVSAPQAKGANTFDELARDRALQIASQISKRSRQEQRVGDLIRTVLDDPSIGRLVVNVYSDRTRFATSATLKLRNVLRRAHDYSTIELQIAKIIPSLVRGAFPRQRGRLLVDLASGMRPHGNVAAVIRDIVLKSKSREIHAVRESVLKNLSE